MYDLHPNTIALMQWADRMRIYSPQETLCRKLAYAMNEAGNEDPSDDALALAAEWERLAARGERPWEEPQE